jgi:DNA anti-recombination protein RmuC
MSDAVKGAIWGTVGTAIVFAGIQWFLLSWVYNPQLDLQKQALDKQERATQAAEQGLALAQRQVQDAIRQRDELERRVGDLRQKWQDARNKFVVEIGRDIFIIMNPPVLEPGQPRGPTVGELAQKLVRDRDAARSQLLQIQEGVQRVYDRLDSEIDRLRDRLAQQPSPSDDEIHELIKQLADRWNDRVRDVNDTVDLLLRSLGCPQIVASNP